ncbi:Ger(x)C family spore germination protein [Cytobacillus kochii]|uniref:Ger(x)C family spore germination protein n=1 Tax=Cytobacillus kochii TaxID=859143 RepID=UPI0025A1AE27|nr:Ger(x)C family spore germination protein [Cytobacillus kochii]MDM5206216.1 Ger(x)C family spore germination protein [Cytobacillus kochii]
MKRVVNFILCFVLLLTCVACESDMKEIQNLNFATALGVDFKDGKYQLYVQLVGLDSVAKTEGEKSQAQTYVSTSSGKTLLDAYFELYKSEQEVIIFSHISTIVVSESILKRGLNHVLDELTRYYEYRLTPWIFATKDPLDKVLSTLGLFKQSSLETLLHHPDRSSKQSTMIRPIKLYQFFRELFEPGKTTFLPGITITENQWENNQKKEPKLTYSGAFFLKEMNYKGFFSLDAIKGIRWTSAGTKRASLKVPDGENQDTIIIIDNIKTKKKLLGSEGGKYQFEVQLDVKASIGNKVNDQKYNKLLAETKKNFTKEIKDLFQLGVEEGVDILDLGHILYRNDFESWEKDKENYLEKSEVAVNADVTIQHASAFKNKRFEEVKERGKTD